MVWIRDERCTVLRVLYAWVVFSTSQHIITLLSRCMFVYVCMYDIVCMYVCMYVYTYVCMYSFYCSMCLGPKLMYIVADLDLIKDVTVKHFDKFVNRTVSDHFCTAYGSCEVYVVTLIWFPQSIVSVDNYVITCLLLNYRQTVAHLPSVLMARCMSPLPELWMTTGEKGDEH